MSHCVSVFTVAGCLFGFVAVTICSRADLPTTQPATTQPVPKPELKPREVVKLVVEALAKNDAGDSGIRTAWEFASPENKKMTGPIERFIPMVKTPAYLPMIGSRSADYGQFAADEAHAEQVVELTDAAGAKTYYVFQLSRQVDGKFKDCWMTDGVMPVDPAAVNQAKRRQGPPV